MILGNGSRQYHIDDPANDLVAKTDSYRLYLCSLNGGVEKTHLLQIATEVAHNGDLDRAAYFLGVLGQHAENLEKEYACIKTDPNDMLNYQLCFPELVDSFVPEGQGDRRVNVLGFRSVDDVRQMVPLHNIVQRDHRRVDLRTSVWIMGKLLKILTFAHDAGMAVHDLSLGNILIEPERHYVVVFNWAAAEKHSEGVSGLMVREEIRGGAQSVIEVLGGSDTETIPNDGDEQYERYADHLLELAHNGNRNADSAHRAFYALVDELWPRGYHPFTSLLR